MRDKILVYGIEFYGRHGVLPEEKSLGQKFIVDLEMYKYLKEAGLNDNLEQTVNYAEAFEVVKNIVEGPSFDLIEAVAEKIAADLLGQFNLEMVMVRIKKPQAPIAGIFDFVAVEIVRGQS